MRILHLEDNLVDAALVEKTLRKHNIAADVQVLSTESDFVKALEKGDVDLILSDHGVPGFSGDAALEIARLRHPEIPFLFLSGAQEDNQPEKSIAAGAKGYWSKDDLPKLVGAIKELTEVTQAHIADAGALAQRHQAMHRLVEVVQELSLAHSVDAIRDIVKHAARNLVGADGATFVLRDGDFCWYVDEDAIEPLWKGQKFPMTACVSGWAMLHGEAAVIEDIYSDARVPVDAYRPTFVKSMVMVPIRIKSSIGAIGTYWARKYQPSPAEVEILQALANTTAVALENVRIFSELEQRVQQRTEQLHAANRELESFSYSVSHDLRAPLRNVGFLANELSEAAAAGNHQDVSKYEQQIQNQLSHMSNLIEDLLRLARVARSDLQCEQLNLSALAQYLADCLLLNAGGRKVKFEIEPNLAVFGDHTLIQAALENLISNAWKFTSKKDSALIRIGSTKVDGQQVHFVEDNGAGFDMRYAEKLFVPFQRLHGQSEFPGTGIGLATVQRIINRHGGKIWAQSEQGRGTIIYFTLPQNPDSH